MKDTPLIWWLGLLAVAVAAVVVNVDERAGHAGALLVGVAVAALVGLVVTAAPHVPGSALAGRGLAHLRAYRAHQRDDVCEVCDASGELVVCDDLIARCPGCCARHGFDLETGNKLG